MKFRDSPFVQRAVEEIDYLQERVREIAVIVHSYDKQFSEEEKNDMKLEFLHTLYALVEKEHNLYIRISLSDDPEANEMKCELDKELISKNLLEYGGMDQYYRDMKVQFKDKIKELSGEDIDDPDDIDIVFNWTDGSDL